MNRTRQKSGNPILYHDRGLLFRAPDTSYPARLLVAPVSWRQRIVSEEHLRGHFGPERCHKVIGKRWWWPSMTKTITAFCKECVSCQRSKTSTQQPYGELQPLDTPECPWEHISLDLVVDLPVCEGGYKNILSVVDRFSKYCVFVPLQSDTSAEAVANAFMHNVVRLFGVPKTVVSDRDRRFTSKFWQKLLESLGIKCKMSTACHPQTDG